MTHSIQITGQGRIEDVTELAESATPQPSDNEVLVKLVAAPIHPSNILLIQGLYPQKVEFPHIMGSEGVGKVVQIGTSVENLEVGQMVLLPGGSGTWQSHFLFQANQVTPIPVSDKETALQLSLVGVNPPTAYLMLHNFVDLEEGDWIIQNASNSSVGRYIIQLASEMGVKTLNVVRRSELIDELKEIGADEVIVDDEKIHQQVKDLVGDGKVKLGIDAVAGDASNRLAKCLSKEGTLVVYGSMSQQPVKLEVGTMLRKDLVIRSFWLSEWYQETEQQKVQQLLQKLSKKIIEGKLSTKIAKTFDLKNYVEALNYADSEAKGGKVLFTSSE